MSWTDASQRGTCGHISYTPPPLCSIYMRYDVSPYSSYSVRDLVTHYTHTFHSPQDYFSASKITPCCAGSQHNYNITGLYVSQIFTECHSDTTEQRWYCVSVLQAAAGLCGVITTSPPSSALALLCRWWFLQILSRSTTIDPVLVPACVWLWHAVNHVQYTCYYLPPAGGIKQWHITY